MERRLYPALAKADFGLRLRRDAMNPNKAAVKAAAITQSERDLICDPGRVL